MNKGSLLLWLLLGTGLSLGAQASSEGPSVAAAGQSAKVQANAADKAELKKRIGKLDSYEAQFSQTVIDVDGKIIMKGKGQVYLAHPSLIRWHATEPDENLMVSDGATLWLYNVDLEQVTATDASKAIDSTPFALLASNDEALWNDYDVSRKGQSFIVVPKQVNGQVVKLTVQFDGDVFVSLTIEDVSKQVSEFVFSQIKSNHSLDKALFRFSVPEGVELDDQRQ